ncbi:disintegrin and metalloproteinase domain-containing protein 9-like isoform X1 [Mauremys mutica]|uniref:disintegrin and metalloproteinase domain-containing protein 9-like isoform X1 n=2 Tax=Mauremys mutica TaxID=74926 RepID=UPI001D164394|nr:disintegrin and metalloproteinase domain-containing protein 9-like isoform X1 [Mauremys mutica]
MPRSLMARDRVLGQGLLLRLGVSMVLLGPLLPSTDCSLHPPPRFASYEVIVPRKLAPKEGKATKDEMSYAIKVEGKIHVVHLKQKKGFLVKNFPVFTYDARGQLRVDQPHIPDDCYYHGYVENTPESYVALSTCSGLKGFLQIGSLNYGIEPVETSFTFQHRLYRTEEMEPKAVKCEVTDGERKRPATVMETRKDLIGKDLSIRFRHTRYLELFIVADKKLFDYHGKNETNVTYLVVDTVNMADSHFQSLKLRILLVGLLIWTQNNPINIPEDIRLLLQSFNDWRKLNISPRVKHDAAHLFIYKNFGTLVGRAYVSGICEGYYGAGVEAYIFNSPILFSKVLSHELGHNLGMEHDHTGCMCGKHTSCIMSEASSRTSLFSNCSKNYFLDLMDKGKGNCLFNIPEPHALFTIQRCGNKVVDRGEDCDCGNLRECRRDPCCHHNCTLKPGAVCSVGQCCRKCKFLPAGRTCRAIADECDLPEYCNGISEWCPEDVYEQDGNACSDNGYCYKGKCATHNLQCESIFGKGARAAPEICFNELNVKADRFGNCGGDGKEMAFEKCNQSNSLCGRVQCVNVKDIPVLEEYATIIQTPMGNGWCWGTDYHPGVDIVDIGVVADGTMCGNTKVCMNRTCMAASVIKRACDEDKKCSRRGVCNNNKNCHCVEGWAPPNCQFHGFGGSIDSGPPPQRVRDKIWWGFWAILGLALLILIALILAIRRFKKSILSCLRRTFLKKAQPKGRPASKDSKKSEGRKQRK